jgi:hypothetical protein
MNRRRFFLRLLEGATAPSMKSHGGCSRDGECGLILSATAAALQLRTADVPILLTLPY